MGRRRLEKAVPEQRADGGQVDAVHGIQNGQLEDQGRRTRLCGAGPEACYQRVGFRMFVPGMGSGS